MSRMYTEDSCRLPMPMRAAPALRLSMSCSRLTYRDFVPCARAFSCIIHRMRDVFIVPGVPATRTVLPFGIPPPRTRSRPSTYVWRIGTSSSMTCVPRNPRYKAVASPLSKEIFFRRLRRSRAGPEGMLL